jgi:nucleotidyltransferase substrate binding protein (TIGR01987 family)
MNKDIRWEQRFSNYKKALASLSKAVALSEVRPLSELEEQGLIKAFEYTYELAWNVMKDFYSYQGGTEKIQGSRDAIRMAVQSELITDGKTWMEMVESRIETVHGYDPNTADHIASRILGKYFALFQSFELTMEYKRGGFQNTFS